MALRTSGGGLREDSQGARRCLRCALGIAEEGAPKQRIDAPASSPRLGVVAAATAQLTMAATGASAEARRVVYER